MFKTLCMIALTLVSTAVLGQGDNSQPLPLDVAQQRARFAREQLDEAEKKLKTATRKDEAAKEELEEARIRAEKSDKTLQEARAQAAKWRELHDQAYQDLKRAHEAMQRSIQPK